MLFDPNITLFLRDLLSWAGEFFKIVSEVGDIPFYVAIIFAAYYTSGKRAHLPAALSPSCPETTSVPTVV